MAKSARGCSNPGRRDEETQTEDGFNLMYAGRQQRSAKIPTPLMANQNLSKKRRKRIRYRKFFGRSAYPKGTVGFFKEAPDELDHPLNVLDLLRFFPGASIFLGSSI